MLLILSEDDTTFTPACREDLIALMPSPTVVTDLTGGHLALLVRLDQYADLVTDFIHQHTLDYSYPDCPCGERENESSH